MVRRLTAMGLLWSGNIGNSISYAGEPNLYGSFFKLLKLYARS